MDVAEVIRQAAQRYGQDPTPWLKTANIESGSNPNIAPNPHSHAAGLFQFIPKTWALYGRGDVNDPVANADAAMRLARDNSARFQSTFGRAPTPGEVYLMHQQGSGGAMKLLQNPSAPAASLVGEQAVLQNGGHAGMTAAQFANLWSSKFDGAPATGGTQVAQAPADGQAVPVPQAPLSAALAALAPQETAPKPKTAQASVLVGGQSLPTDPYLS